MHSAVNGLGGGGLGDVRLSDIANSVLYACFFISGFFSGSVNVCYKTTGNILHHPICIF